MVFAVVCFWSQSTKVIQQHWLCYRALCSFQFSAMVAVCHQSQMKRSNDVAVVWKTGKVHVTSAQQRNYPFTSMFTEDLDWDEQRRLRRCKPMVQGLFFLLWLKWKNKQSVKNATVIFIAATEILLTSGIDSCWVIRLFLRYFLPSTSMHRNSEQQNGFRIGIDVGSDGTIIRTTDEEKSLPVLIVKKEEKVGNIYFHHRQMKRSQSMTIDVCDGRREQQRRFDVNWHEKVSYEWKMFTFFVVVAMIPWRI